MLKAAGVVLQDLRAAFSHAGVATKRCNFRWVGQRGVAVKRIVRFITRLAVA